MSNNTDKQMITELTDAQKAKMPEYVKKWIGIGTNTDRIAYDECVDIIHEVQEHLLNTEKTAVILVDNPFEAWVACNLANTGTAPNDIMKGVKAYFEEGKKIKLEAFSMPYLAGSFDAAMFSFYDYFQQEVGIDYKEATDKYRIWQNTSKLGLIFPMENVVIVSQKPRTIKLNEQGQAHCDGGPAIEYSGYGDVKIYMLNGVRVPEWLATTHSAKIDISKYNNISNADVKAEFVRKVGIERMLSTGKLLDTYTKYNDKWWNKSEYELWDMHNLFQGVAYAPHLKMRNQSVPGVWHVEAVSPECRTLADAIKERLGGMDLEIVDIK